VRYTLVVSLIAIAFTSAAQAKPGSIDKARWTTAVVGALPRDASVTTVTPSVVPDGWISEQPAALLVAGKLGTATFKIWIVPRDWVGIRKPDSTRGPDEYWSGIVANADAAAITVSTDDAVLDALRKLGMSTTSLVNGGGLTAWTGRLDTANASAEHLIATYCHDAATRDEAVYSLVVLGVPAADVFRATALDPAATERTRSFAIESLAQFPGPTTSGAIAQVLGEPTTPDKHRAAAAYVAEQLGDRAHGPVLAFALGHAVDHDARSKLISAIVRVRYQPAAAAIYEALRHEPSPYTQADLSAALASLRYIPAIAEIRHVADDPFKPYGNPLGKDTERELHDRARLALFVLTGTWGAPAKGWRFALQAPPQAKLGDPIHAQLFAENVSDQVMSYFAAVLGTLVIDGVAQPRGLTAVDGVDSFFPNQVITEDQDLTKLLPTRGKHRVSYVVDGVHSNEIVIDVR